MTTHTHQHAEPHTHTHGMARQHLRLAFFLTIIILVSQLIGGFLANSLALYSEAGHVVTDLFALGLAWFAAAQAERPANERNTFGYHRVGILAALINAALLIAIAITILFEAIQRLQHPEAVQPLVMFITPIFSIGINLYIALALREGGHNLNTRAAALHVIGDMGASAAVIVGGLIVLLSGWLIVDPLLSVGIAVLIAIGSWRVVREATMILLESTPRGLAVNEMVAEMKKIAGVEDVHDLHVWTIASGMSALSCHAMIADLPPSESATIRHNLTGLLRDKYQISHATIQFESSSQQDACCQNRELYCCLDQHDHSSHADPENKLLQPSAGVTSEHQSG